MQSQEERQALQLYLEQARATARLLKATNFGGHHDQRLAEIKAQIKKARQRLKKPG